MPICVKSTTYNKKLNLERSKSCKKISKKKGKEKTHE